MNLDDSIVPEKMSRAAARGNRGGSVTRGGNGAVTRDGSVTRGTASGRATRARGGPRGRTRGRPPRDPTPPDPSGSFASPAAAASISTPSISRRSKNGDEFNHYFTPRPIPAEEFRVLPPITDGGAGAGDSSNLEDPLMRPGRIPVVDPNAVHDDYLSLRVTKEAFRPSPQDLVDRVVESYVPTKDTMDVYEQLDVIVCGKCQSVFHLIDEFKSHKSTCQQKESNQDLEGSSDHAVAMVMWCNTIRRRLTQSGVVVSDAENVGRQIQQKWFRLSHKARSSWLKAAKSLRALGFAGKIVFGGREHYNDLVVEYKPPLWVEGQNGGPSLLEIKQEVREQWSTLGDDVSEDDNAAFLPPVVVVPPVAAPSSSRQRDRRRKRTNSSLNETSYAQEEIELPNAVAACSKVTEQRRSSSLASCSTQTEEETLGEVEDILAKRGREYCVTYKNRVDPVWQSESELDHRLIRDFEERSNPPPPPAPLQSVIPTATPEVYVARRGRPRGRGRGSRGARGRGRGRGSSYSAQQQQDLDLSPSADRPKRMSQLKAMSRVKQWASDKSLNDDEDSSSGKEENGQSALQQGDYQAEFIRTMLKKTNGETGNDSADADPAETSAPSPPDEVEVIKLGRAGALTLLQATETMVWGDQGGSGRKRKTDTSAATASVVKKKRKVGRPRKRKRSDSSEESSEPEVLMTKGPSGSHTKTLASLTTPGGVGVPLAKYQTRNNGVNKGGDDIEDEVPHGVARVIPEGFGVVKHVNARGAVEYRLKNKPEPSASKSKASGSGGNGGSGVPPKVLEFGSFKDSSNSTSGGKDLSNVKTILVGNNGGSNLSTKTKDERLAEVVSIASKGASNLVRLTYKPSAEELLATCSSGGLNGIKSNKGLIVTSSNKRQSPTSHEVSSTTDPKEQLQEVTTTTTTLDHSGNLMRLQSNIQQQPLPTFVHPQENEFSLDPTSGFIIDKDGTPLQMLRTMNGQQQNGELNQQEETVAVTADGQTGLETTTFHLTPSSAAAAVTVGAGAEQVLLQAPLYSTVATTSGDHHLLHQQNVTYDYQQQDCYDHHHTMESTQQQQHQYINGTLQMSEDGTLMMESNGATLEQQAQYLAAAAPNGDGAATPNKVLLVLPGGQMILTDLTDEQCVQLNITVNHNETSVSGIGGDDNAAGGSSSTDPQLTFDGNQFANPAAPQATLIRTSMHPDDCNDYISASTEEEDEEEEQQQQVVENTIITDLSMPSLANSGLMDISGAVAAAAAAAVEETDDGGEAAAAASSSGPGRPSSAPPPPPST